MRYFIVCFILIIVNVVVAVELYPIQFQEKEDFLILKKHVDEYCRRESNTKVNVAHCYNIQALPYNMTHFIRIPQRDEKFFVNGKLKIIRKGGDVYHFFHENDEGQISSFYKTLYESL